LFDIAVENLKKLVKTRNKIGSNLEISLKFLIHPKNSEFIYESAKLAKEIGVDYIHIRPAAAENVLGGFDYHLEFPLETINEQVRAAFELEDESFRVFGIRHKFSNTLHLRRKFTRCLAPPLLINCGPDGHVYLCVDHRGKRPFSLGTHYPDPENILTFWGSEKHKNMMKCVDLNKCPRCTFGPYNEIIEKAIVEDRMCRNFP